MASYFSLHAYDADVWVREFKGLNQADESLNSDPRYATETLNVETPGGVLQPNAGYEILDGEFTGRVETLASFHRRWYTGPGSKNFLVCGTGGKLYCRQQDDETGWIQIAFPTGVTSYLNNVWSWVTYEKNVVIGDDNVTVDVLLMSNADDGMIMVIPPDKPKTWQDAIDQNLTWANDDNETWQDEVTSTWTVQAIDTRYDPSDSDEPQKKFAVIERFAERIFGCGVPDEPDTIYYSQAYDPTNWESEADIPEDSAGEIRQPSWDGDSFCALKAFGNQLLAFKKNRVWRLAGTYPGEYAMSEQYGGGAQYPATVAVDVERVLMAGNDGMSSYDGMSVTPYIRDQIRDIWKTVNRDALDQMCAVLFKNRYYLSIPVDGSSVNNAFLVVNNDEGTILYYKDMKIESLMASDERLYATSSSLPGRVLTIGYDSWSRGKSSGAATRWVSPWMDFGYKRIQKGGFDLYFLGEVQDLAVTLKFSIQTEKKTKTKLFTVQRTEREHRMKRLHFGGTGRRFRIIIETGEGNKAPWRLIGGLQLVVETDPD